MAQLLTQLMETRQCLVDLQAQFPDVQSTFDSATFRNHKFTNEGFLQWGYYSKMDGL